MLFRDGQSSIVYRLSSIVYRLYPLSTKLLKNCTCHMPTKTEGIA